MTMKKILIIIVCVVVVGAVAWLVWHAYNSAAPATGVEAPSAQTNANGLVPVYRIPTSTTITMGGPRGTVTMDNFYAKALGADDQFIVMAQNANYEITYDTNTNNFYLTITQAPFDANRIQAESGFLSLLNIDQSDACKLSVSEGFASGSLYGSQTLALSFCGTGAIPNQ
jgi:hypothetical protein